MFYLSLSFTCPTDETTGFDTFALCFAYLCRLFIWPYNCCSDLLYEIPTVRSYDLIDIELVVCVFIIIDTLYKVVQKKKEREIMISITFSVILVYLKLEIFIHAKKISDRPCNDIFSFQFCNYKNILIFKTKLSSNYANWHLYMCFYFIFIEAKNKREKMIEL